MKTNRPIDWIRMALLCMALVLIFSLMTIPLLAKGIAHISGNPVEPGKLDIRPIPVPVPPQPLAHKELPLSAAPAHSFAAAPAPEAIPVPTPSVETAQSGSVLAQNSEAGLFNVWKFSMVTRVDVFIAALSFFVLMILVYLRRTLLINPLNRKSV